MSPRGKADLNRLGLAINDFAKQEVYDQIWAETGLTCSQSSLSELMSVTFAKRKRMPSSLAMIPRGSDGEVNISVAAPSRKSAKKILAVLDEQVQGGLRAQVAQTAENRNDL